MQNRLDPATGANAAQTLSRGWTMKKALLFVLFDYSAADGSRDIGIDISRKGKKIATIPGRVDSVKGSLSSLEDYPVQKR